MEFTLEPDQRRAVNELKKIPYSLLHGDIGCGKSLICLTLQNEIVKNKTVIVVPSYLLNNWAGEITKFYPTKKYKIINATKKIKLESEIEIYLISYGILKGCDSLFEWAELVIVDECQNAKNIAAAKTNTLHKLVYENSINRLILASGTPITNRVWEFYSALALCEYSPHKLDSPFLKKFSNYVIFANYFSNRQEFKIKQGNYFKTIIKWEGIRNVEELKTWLSRVRVRVRLEDVMGGSLPEINSKDIDFEEVDFPELEEAFNSFIDEGGESVASNVKARAALETVPLTVQYVKDLRESGVNKVLVYSDHVEAAEAIAKAFGISAITGKSSIPWRKRLGDEFQEGIAPILVATMGAFSTGVTLTSCNHTVFNDIPWTPTTLEQAMGRTRRKGQKKMCNYHFIYKFIQSKKIKKVLENKSKVIKMSDESKEKWKVL